MIDSSPVLDQLARFLVATVIGVPIALAFFRLAQPVIGWFDRPSSRHLSWWVVLVLTVFLGGGFLGWPASTAVGPVVDQSSSAAVPLAVSGVVRSWQFGLLRPVAHAIAVCWVVVILTLLVRLAFGAARLAGIVRRSRSGRRYRLSAEIDRPMVLGWLRPTVLLPVGIERRLGPNEIELVVRHEEAHIRRGDPVFNLVLRIIESLLFFHPAVWLVGREIRLEREIACDQLAAVEPADRRRLARGLARIALADRQSEFSGLVPAAADSTNHLMRRIDMLTSKPTERAASPLRLGALVLISILVLVTWAVASPGARVTIVEAPGSLPEVVAPAAPAPPPPAAAVAVAPEPPTPPMPIGMVAGVTAEAPSPVVAPSAPLPPSPPSPPDAVVIVGVGSPAPPSPVLAGRVVAPAAPAPPAFPAPPAAPAPPSPPSPVEGVVVGIGSAAPSVAVVAPAAPAPEVVVVPRPAR